MDVFSLCPLLVNIAKRVDGLGCDARQVGLDVVRERAKALDVDALTVLQLLA